ncbi:hypothetical protein [Alkalicoccus luteus]|uniref:YvbJ-like NTF2-like domain-containing protein n=1 Tax=Alkalicoccus luteus TaxID=1237094 RepID=A0A969TVF6_9BACI|nr:hypothetical protein [Alkalicoccus luteus]NJP38350.1 hypothetical protein [Alkalicoccus luteus]
MEDCPVCGSERTERVCSGCGYGKKKTAQWISFGAVGAGLLLFIAIPQLLSAGNPPKETVAELEEAVAQGDTERIAELTVLANSDEQLTINQAAPMSLYLQEEGHDVFDRLYDQAAEVADGAQISEDEPWRIVREGNFFSSYSIEVTPVPFFTAGGFVGLELLMEDGTAVTVSEDVHALYGPVLPGIYEAELFFEGEYTTVDQTASFTIEGPDTAVIELEPGAGRLDIEVPDSAVLTIRRNGQEIDHRLTTDAVFPFDESFSIEAARPFPDGRASTGDTIVQDSSPDLSSLDADSELAAHLAETFENYVWGVAAAESRNDENLLTSAKDSLRRAIEEEMRIRRAQGFMRKTDELLLETDPEQAEVFETEGVWIGRIPFHIERTDTWYRHGDAFEQSSSERSGIVHLEFDEETKRWLVGWVADLGSASFSTETPKQREEVFDWSGS